MNKKSICLYTFPFSKISLEYLLRINWNTVLLTCTWSARTHTHHDFGSKLYWYVKIGNLQQNLLCSSLEIETTRVTSSLMENSWMLVALVWWAWDFHLRLSPIPVRIDVLTQAELPGTRKVPGQPRQRKVLSKYSCPSFTMLSRQATTPQWTRGPWTYRYFNTPVCWARTHLPARPCVKEWTRTFYLLLVFGGRFKSDIYR